MTADDQKFLNLTRPDPKLLTWYVLRSLPTFLLLLIPSFFRYRTLEYRFDDKGVHMKWGILFRREINLTYARLQDIQVRSNFVQRWLGLADVELQTASGSAQAEMIIEGVPDPDGLRDFLYRQMGGKKEVSGTQEKGDGDGDEDEVAVLLTQIANDLKAVREALEQRA